MKITEVAKTHRQALQESLEQNNDTGFATKDLMQIYDMHVNGDWEETTFEEELARLNALPD